MKKIEKIICVILLCLIFCVGCNKEAEPKTDEDNAAPTSSATDITPETDDKDNSEIGKQVIDLGDLDAEDLKVYPAEKNPSMYFYSAQQMVDDVFFPDQEDILGIPYFFNGTVLEEYDDITEYLNLNEKTKQYVGSGVSSKAFKIMTKKGPVIVFDILPDQINYMKNAYSSNLNELSYYKRLYNQLSPYKDFPEIGTTGCFYGFYFGFDQNSECPVFSYGVSMLARRDVFPVEYAKYSTKDTKHYKYRNLFEMDYPVGWSDDITADDKYFFSGDEIATLDIQDWEEADWSLEEAMDMILAQFTGTNPMNPDDDYDPSEFLKINNKEKRTIGADNSIQAYIIDYSYKYYNDEWNDSILVLFYTKRNLIIMDFYEYPEGYDDVLPAKTEDGESLYRIEFDNLLSTIKLCGY